MALLKLMIDLQRLHKWKLHIWHGDHGWHNQSGCIAKELKDWCTEKGLTFFFDQTTKEQTKNEAEARNWRYKQLAKTVKMLSSKDKVSPCTHVLTGHTGSDRAETVLLNLARGSDLAGISSLKIFRKLDTGVNLVRPLLGFSRYETFQICKEMNLPIWLDPSNKNLTLSRNRIRQEVIPVLEDLHPGSSMRMASLAERLSHYKEDQHAMAQLLLKALEHPNGICRQSLFKLPLTARGIVLAEWLKQKGVPSLSALQLEELSCKIGKRKPPGYLQLTKNWRVKWEQKVIQLQHPNSNKN